MKKIFILLILICLLIPYISAQNTTIDTLNASQINFDFDKSIKVPDNLQIPAKIIFGITGEIEFQLFVILIALWISILLLITQILKFVPIIKQGFISWITAVVITCLVALSGGLHQAVLFFFSLGNLFGLLEKWPALGISSAIVIIILIAYGTGILLKILRKRVELDQAESKGRDVNVMTEIAKTEAESLKKEK